MADPDVLETPMLTFNDLLAKAGYDLKLTRFMRHKDKEAARGRTLYELWRDEPDAFEEYQAIQSDETLRESRHWASFVVTPQGDTMFVGLYDVEYAGLNETAMTWPTTGAAIEPGTEHVYKTKKSDVLKAFEGRIFIDWGRAFIKWCQYADRNDKPILEIKKTYSDPAFPGYLNFISTVTQIPTLPLTWIEALKNAKGIYVLTCPREKELYVGSATGSDGFYGRWCEYARNGHGGNVKLRARDRSEYQVSILEIACSSMTTQEIQNLESHWKNKLQTREMGLNSN